MSIIVFHSRVFSRVYLRIYVTLSAVHVLSCTLRYDLNVSDYRRRQILAPSLNLIFSGMTDTSPKYCHLDFFSFPKSQSNLSSLFRWLFSALTIKSSMTTCFKVFRYPRIICSYLFVYLLLIVRISLVCVVYFSTG